MTEKTVYICDKCKEQFSNEKEAMQCEKSHIAPVSIVDNHTNYLSRFNSSDYIYPNRIRVRMADGSEVTYYYRKHCSGECDKKE